MRAAFGILVGCCLASNLARADEEPKGLTDATTIEGFGWKTFGDGDLGERARVPIPLGHVFLNGDDTSKLIEAMGNLSDKDELGLLGRKDLGWFAVFLFDEIGYVKDDEKDELDADKLAQQARESIEYSNKVREERGLASLTFDGWAMPPRFNDKTKQLEWATRLRSEGGVSVNYHTRLLGREGVMRVILVTDPERLETSLPEYQRAMEGFSFVEGQRYAEFRQGDKIAEYGLAALVAGGVTAVAAKTGLLSGLFLFLKKGIKLIIVAVVALFAGISKLFGRKSRNRDDGFVPPDPE